MATCKDTNDNKISYVMWQIKGLAIISVVFAHCNIQMDGLEIGYLQRIMSNIGSVGVGLFLFVSGFYFKCCDLKKKEYIKSKIKMLILPWVIASSFVWLYIVLRKGGISLNGYLRFVLGVGSIYYYMTNYVLIYTIFCIIDKTIGITNIICVVLILIGQLFLMLEVAGYCFFPTPYLDFIYFSAFFSLGVLAKANIKLFIYLSKGIDKFYMIGIVLALLILFMPMEVSYFGNNFSLLLEIYFIVIIFLTLMVIQTDNKILYDLGKTSFYIYLWHIPIAGIVSKLGSYSIYTAYMSAFWPFTIIFIVVLVMFLIKKCINPKYYYLFGLR